MPKNINSIIGSLTYKPPANVEGFELLEDTTEKPGQENGRADYGSGTIKQKDSKRPFSTDN